MLKITGQELSILIAGDIEYAQEQKLIRANKNDLESTILVAPHHGSSTSSSVSFVDAVAADHVIFTTGYLNRWKFPRSEIVERFLESGSQIYQTDKNGAITIQCSSDDCELHKYRQQHPRIWY